MRKYDIAKKIRPGLESKTKAYKKSADEHTKGNLELSFIESNYRASYLYQHIRDGQIQQKDLRHMKKDDLFYIAGHTQPNPSLITKGKNGKEIHDEYTRVIANATRAQQELQRRERFRNLWITSIITVLAALLGAFAGSYFSNLAQSHKDCSEVKSSRP